METAPNAGKAATWQAVCVCVVLVLVVLAVFGQTAHFGFVNFDDGLYVYENARVSSSLSMPGVAWAFTHVDCSLYHPLTMISLMLDYQLHGLHAGGYHLTSVFIHAASVVLLFLVLRQTTGALWRSAFAAALFAIHPLRAESVAWVSERKDVLSGLFFMLTLFTYLRYVEKQKAESRKQKYWYVLTVVFFALGLLAKSMVATLPFVLLLLDYWPLGRMGGMQNEKCRMKNAESGKRKAESGKQKIGSGEKRPPGVPFWGLVREKIPLFALSAGSCVATALVPGLIIHVRRLPFLECLGNALFSYVVYLRQMVFPAGLAIPYPIVPGGPPRWEVCLAFFLLAAITAAVIACRKKLPCLLMGWLWYLGMLFPVIGIIQISGDAAHADRFTYLPEIGLAVAGTWAAWDWIARWKHRLVISGVLMMAVIGALSVFAHIQTSYWRDGETLWPHTLACTSSNCIAYCNLAAILVEKGANEEAIARYGKALEIKPDNPQEPSNVGDALLNQGDKDEAVALCRKALEIRPDYIEAHINLGNALSLKGEEEAAIAEFRKALEIDPDNEKAHYNLGIALFDKGEKEAAIAQYRKALELKPDNAEARANLAVALFDKGEKEEAIAQYHKTLELKPNDADTRSNLGIALFDKGEKAEAIAQYRKALELDPHCVKADYNWGNALASEGQLDEAIAHLRKALKFKPNYARAYSSLGLVFFQKGEIKEAIGTWEGGLEVKPDQADVQNNLAWLLATAPDASLRNGTKAVALAERASHLNGGSNAPVLHTLAAAYAEVGRFGDARTTAQRALDLAVAQKNDDLTAQLPKEIKLYEADRPVRDAPQ
jgi:tetratricopeptide (TPR) repeat protein